MFLRLSVFVTVLGNVGLRANVIAGAAIFSGRRSPSEFITARATNFRRLRWLVILIVTAAEELRHARPAISRANGIGGMNDDARTGAVGFSGPL